MINPHITPPPVAAVKVRYRVVKASQGPILQRRVDFSDGKHETKPIGIYFGSIEPRGSEDPGGYAKKWLVGIQADNQSLLFLDPEGNTPVATGSRYEEPSNGRSRFHFYQPLTSREKENIADLGDDLWLEQKPEAKP